MSIDNIIIRSMGNDDAEPLALLLAKLYHDIGVEPPFEGHLLADRLKEQGLGNNPSFYALLAFHKARAAGMLMYSKSFDPVFASTGGYVSALYVNESSRGHKVGSALVARMAQIALKSKWSHLEWSTKLAQKSASPFIEHFFEGYRKSHSRILFGEDMQKWAKDAVFLYNQCRGEYSL